MPETEHVLNSQYHKKKTIPICLNYHSAEFLVTCSWTNLYTDAPSLGPALDLMPPKLLLNDSMKLWTWNWKEYKLTFPKGRIGFPVHHLNANNKRVFCIFINLFIKLVISLFSYEHLTKDLHFAAHINEVSPSCLTLSDPMGCTLPGSSIHGIFQARVLECIAIAFPGRLLKLLQI